jgi:hypothetical protein
MGGSVPIFPIRPHKFTFYLYQLHSVCVTQTFCSVGFTFDTGEGLVSVAELHYFDCQHVWQQYYKRKCLFLKLLNMKTVQPHNTSLMMPPNSVIYVARKALETRYICVKSVNLIPEVRGTE